MQLNFPATKGHTPAGPASLTTRAETFVSCQSLAKRRRLDPRCVRPTFCSSTQEPAPNGSSFSDSTAAKVLARYGRSQQALKRGLPPVDWHRYHLQILFVDRTDTVRARMAAGLLEKVAEWNGLGRALYPQSCGISVPEQDAVDPSTSMTLMTQAGHLGIRTKIFAAPRERLVREDLDRFDVVVAVDADIREGVLQMAGPEHLQYYSRKVAVLTDFSKYCGPDLLREGGTAILAPFFRSRIAADVEEACAAQGISRPSLQQGPDGWNHMVQTIVVACAGLTQYCSDSWPPDLPDFDPV
ncbi:hypothetical protein WJX74_008158 [Apatococcus lobatus]|uniref:Phosphotyrosine protein phosphatase I domain-containing protein n=1 Tax=Apatococcus lobatus TaxID=904363 RepID=A0AAW1QJT0_9CHLO